MRFLNGFKTALGALGLVVVALSDASVLVLLPENVRPYVAGAAGMLMALGLVHKKEKRDEEKKDEEMHQAIMQRLREDAERNGEP